MLVVSGVLIFNWMYRGYVWVFVDEMPEQMYGCQVLQGFQCWPKNQWPVFHVVWQDLCQESDMDLHCLKDNHAVHLMGILYNLRRQ